MRLRIGAVRRAGCERGPKPVLVCSGAIKAVAAAATLSHKLNNSKATLDTMLASSEVLGINPTPIFTRSSSQS